MHPDGGDAICGQSLCGPNITSIRPHCRSELFNAQSTAREQARSYSRFLALRAWFSARNGIRLSRMSPTYAPAVGASLLASFSTRRAQLASRGAGILGISCLKPRQPAGLPCCASAAASSSSARPWRRRTCLPNAKSPVPPGRYQSRSGRYAPCPSHGQHRR